MSSAAVDLAPKQMRLAVTTYVLVHGANHGGWCWQRVAQRLRAAGHQVYAPTLTGMGERAHLLSREVGLDTHVRDVLGVLAYEDLSQVVLVGHSYAGMVLSALAEEAADRLAHLVYLDAFTPRDGESALDLEPPATAAAFTELARTRGDGWRLVPQEAWLDRWGLRDEADRHWVWSKLTDMPLRCFQQPVALPGDAARRLPRTFIDCSRPKNEGLRLSTERARQEGWPCRDLPTGHDAMVTAPQPLTDLLLAAGER